MIRDTGIVACWFGRDDARRAAAERGVKALAYLNPLPAAGILMNLGGDAFGDWPWTERMLPCGPEHEGIWHKEPLWNLGAKAIIRENPGITKLLFLDLDVHPAEGDEDWLLNVSIMLDNVQVGHPWFLLYESNADGEWPYVSYSGSASKGVGSFGVGHGFAVAMTKDWFTATGGWPEDSMSGGGDIIAAVRWDANAPDNAGLVGTKAAIYTGPKTCYGCCTTTLIHEWHGARRGAGATRQYAVAALLWEWCGGPCAVLERDVLGLWRWQKTPLANAVRTAIMAGPKSSMDMFNAWRTACYANGIDV